MPSPISATLIPISIVGPASSVFIIDKVKKDSQVFWEVNLKNVRLFLRRWGTKMSKMMQRNVSNRTRWFWRFPALKHAIFLRHFLRHFGSLKSLEFPDILDHFPTLFDWAQFSDLFIFLKRKKLEKFLTFLHLNTFGDDLSF